MAGLATHEAWNQTYPGLGACGPLILTFTPLLRQYLDEALHNNVASRISARAGGQVSFLILGHVATIFVIEKMFWNLQEPFQESSKSLGHNMASNSGNEPCPNIS